MDAFLQRMIHRFHEQVFQRMPPERRARKLAVMKALAKSVKNKNKENENPLNTSSNMALPFSVSHSTPLKNQQVTDLDEVESETEAGAETELTESELCGVEEEDEETCWGEPEEQKMVISKIYNLTNNGDCEEDSLRCLGNELGETSVTVLPVKEMDDKSDKHWRSLEALHENAEYEFCRSLEESKLFVSTSSLLEEIEADLPSPYSLAKPLDHTFHTLTSYRTQTRLARMDAHVTCPENLKEKESSQTKIPSRKLDHLEMEAIVQKALAEQAEKALILAKAKKFFGVQHVESEKALLLANLRCNAIMQEAKKLRMLGEFSEKENCGQITISDICFEVNDSRDNYPADKYICTATEKERVQSTSVISEIKDGKLHFNQSLKFSNLRKDFVIYIDLFKLICKEPKGSLLTTALVRKLKKITAVNLNRSLTSSSYSRCGFTCVGQCELRLEDIVGRMDGRCVLHNYLTNLQHPIAGNTINVLVKTDIHIKSKHSGFLNVFKRTWHRRWYSQTSYFLESWVYPEDQESDKTPVDSLYLPNCSSVEAVGLDVCVRPHSFIITLKESKEEILFSANSHKDMLIWVDHLNLTLEQIHLWKPNA